MFEKGQSGNPGGRPKGAKDKTTSEIRDIFKGIVEGNLDKVESWLRNVAKENPAKATELFLRLSEFILPKLKSVDLNSNSEDQIIIVRGPFMEGEKENPNQPTIIVNDQETEDMIMKLG